MTRKKEKTKKEAGRRELQNTQNYIEEMERNDEEMLQAQLKLT